MSLSDDALVLALDLASLTDCSAEGEEPRSILNGTVLVGDVHFHLDAILVRDEGDPENLDGEGYVAVCPGGQGRIEAAKEYAGDYSDFATVSDGEGREYVLFMHPFPA